MGYSLDSFDFLCAHFRYCGSCWTFSTTGNLEGTHFFKTGELERLAEEQIVSCDVDMDGCDGGYPYAAMQYISKMGGIVHEEKVR